MKPGNQGEQETLMLISNRFVHPPKKRTTAGQPRSHQKPRPQPMEPKKCWLAKSTIHEAKQVCDDVRVMRCNDDDDEDGDDDDEDDDGDDEM